MATEKDISQMSVSERRKHLAVMQQMNDINQTRIDQELAQLGTLRKGSAAYKEQAAKLDQMQKKWEETSKILVKYNAELEEAASLTNQASKEVDNLGAELQGIVRKVPLIGDRLANGVQSATDSMKKSMDNWVAQSNSNMGKKFKKGFLMLAGLVTGILVVALAGWLKLLGKANDRMKEMSTALTEAGRTLQLSKKDVQSIGKGVGDWQHYGAGWSSAIAGIRENMGYLPKLTREENKLVAQLSTNAGVSSEHIASMYRTSQRLGVSLTDYTKNQAEKIKNLNKEMGLQVTQADVVAEMAGASDETLAMFGKQNAELEKQVLIGKKIGLNLNQQAAMAKSLLDIESSIEAEMEARVLTGKEINFDKARELALSGDVSGAAEELMAQVGGINEFNKMNIIQKEALAKAAGMEVGQMKKALEMQAGIKDAAAV